MNLVRTLIICGIINIAFYPIPIHSIETRGTYFDPLVYSHLIVFGVVESISPDSTTLSDWGQKIEPKTRDVRIRIEILNVKIIELLKGDYKDSNVSIIMKHSPVRLGTFCVGDTLVLCANYLETLKGGSYYFDREDAVHRQDDGQWVRRWARGKRKDIMTFEEIKRMVDEAKIENISREADVIARGTIASIKHSYLKGPEGTKARMIEVTMNIYKVFKGEVNGDTLKFKMLRIGSYQPRWLTLIPREIKVGEEWYVFLKKEEEIGYFPIMGKNGLLRINGEKIIYDNNIVYKYSRVELEKIIIEEVSHEGSN